MKAPKPVTRKRDFMKTSDFVPINFEEPIEEYSSENDFPLFKTYSHSSAGFMTPKVKPN